LLPADYFQPQFRTEKLRSSQKAVDKLCCITWFPQLDPRLSTAIQNREHADTI
jgi:hypothetical protein